MKGSLPKRYARALIDLAKEDGQVDVYGDQLQSLLLALQQSKGALSTLANDSFDLFEKLRAIEEICQTARAAVYVKNFLLILIKKGRMGLFPQIVQEYRLFQDEISGIVRAVVRSPLIPDQALLKSIENILHSKLDKKIIARGEAHPEMIGGLSVEIQHRVVDGSIKRKLERIQEAMLR